MATMLPVDDELLAKARQATGIHEDMQLVHDGLRSLIGREAARKLIARGGSDPNAWAPNEGDEPPA